MHTSEGRPEAQGGPLLGREVAPLGQHAVEPLPLPRLPRPAAFPRRRLRALRAVPGQALQEPFLVERPGLRPTGTKAPLRGTARPPSIRRHSAGPAFAGDRNQVPGAAAAATGS